MLRLLFSILCCHCYLIAFCQGTLDLESMDHQPGYIDFYWDEYQGKIYLVINKLDQELLYNTGLSAGIGSNDIGLDRGQLGSEHVVKFIKSGNKILFVELNTDYRAISENQLERRAVEEAFAQSVLWGFKVEQNVSDGYIVDATPFFLRDAHNVKGRLSQSKQGSYKVDESRCVIFLPRTKNFPKNSEFEAVITLTGEPKGQWIRSVTPSADAVTVRQHHSFIELPDPGYEPRHFDPRSGYGPLSYFDFATPIHEPISKKFIRRHRLHKKDPSAPISEAVEPIIYYLDPGAPEPIRSALVGGAQWWNQAFEAAGYKDAFQVKILPADADPMDVRYNLIQWVHRSTRGWSYGSSVVDPRTGEIIKGHVSLGSLRVRQDFLIAQGLKAVYTGGEDHSEELVEMALARLRQLSAHEVGHTLGLSHNFAASTNDRASVMDYPHPLVQLGPDGVDFNGAYDTKIGAWDLRTILYGYQDFPTGQDEAIALQRILQENEALGLRYISDQDARPAGGAHPHAHLWDNGSSVIDELSRLIEVREEALRSFGIDNIPMGMPIAELENVLVPLYLAHRYQTEAVTKLIGGLEYTYAVRDSDNDYTTEVVAVKVQEDALNILIELLNPDFLTLPESIISLLPPRPMGSRRDRELFEIRTGLTFDPIGAAEASAGFTLEFLFNPQRLSRVIEYQARDETQLSIQDIFEEVEENLDRFCAQEGLRGTIGEVVYSTFVDQLMRLARDKSAHHQVGGAALSWLDKIGNKQLMGTDIHRQSIQHRIKAFLRSPSSFEVPALVELPAGSPIGCGQD
ncbi:MAG: zinc-dependent metalloprotease [Saprospiraceae bacterium]|nr:zinc-dependent metalloprotease [Saprospiraceae bacterium]